MLQTIRQNLRTSPWLLALAVGAWLAVALASYLEGRVLVAFGVDAPRTLAEALRGAILHGDDLTWGWKEDEMRARLIARPFEVALTLFSLSAFAAFLALPGSMLSGLIRVRWRFAVTMLVVLVAIDAGVTWLRFEVIATEDEGNDLQAGLLYLSFVALAVVVLGFVLADQRRAISMSTTVFVALAIGLAFAIALMSGFASVVYELGPFDWSPWVELKRSALVQVFTLPVAVAMGVLLAWYAFEHHWEPARPTPGPAPERSSGW